MKKAKKFNELEGSFEKLEGDHLNGLKGGFVSMSNHEQLQDLPNVTVKVIVVVDTICGCWC